MHVLKHKLAQAIAACAIAREATLDAAAIEALFSAPPKAELGDLALPMFPFAKALKMKPPEAAARLKGELEALGGDKRDIMGLCSELRVVGPYLNFFVRADALTRMVLEEVRNPSFPRRRESRGQTDHSEQKTPGNKVDSSDSAKKGAVSDSLDSRLRGNDGNTAHYGDNDTGAGKVCVIDFSSPNIAKPLGVHHLRSTMIGNSLTKIYAACGWTVYGVNHLGDWGTTFGKLIAGFCDKHPDIVKKLEAVAPPTQGEIDALFAGMTIEDLNKIYVEFSNRAKNNPALENAGKREFAVLEQTRNMSGGLADEHGRRNESIWLQIRKISLQEFEKVYALLGVRFGHKDPYQKALAQAILALAGKPTPTAVRHEAQEALPDKSVLANYYTGESTYTIGCDHSDARRIVEEAQQAKIAEESDGALVVFVHGRDKPPLMLLKNDGATTYHARDMAAAVDRATKFGCFIGDNHVRLDDPDRFKKKVPNYRSLYLVGSEQSLHFSQLFKALKMLGYEWADQLEHVDFGLVLAKDETTGKWAKFSTRRGKTVLLHDLLAEAIEQVKRIVAEKNPALAKDEKKLHEISTAVGVGAVVFNDLKHGRRADVKFDWDEMLNFSGETGPYMLYQYVRLGSVQRKYAERYGTPAPQPELDYTRLTHPHERELLKAIAAFPEVVERACRENEPSVISRYLLDLSALFSSYWTATKDDGIVGDDAALSRARIELVGALRKVLGWGLTLLGLRLVEEM